MNPHGSAVGLDHDDDAAHLKSLGYTYNKTFRRDMTYWGNVALGFTYLSPIVGVYAMFAISLGTAGPPMVWALVIALIGQFFVALIFGEVVSNYPVAGGVYPWSRRLYGRRWSWMNGWIYLVALIGTIAGVAYGAAPFLGTLIGYNVTVTTTIITALAILAFATVLNLSGTRVLSIAAMVGLTAELVGGVAISLYLLIFARKQDFSIVFDSFGAGEPGGYFAAFAAAALIGMYAYYGFEANGDVAEEIKNPSRQIPKSMRMTLYIGGFAANLVAFSLVFAVPDIGRVISGDDADPITNVLQNAFGPIGYKLALIVVCLAFLSCLISLQAAASRLAYSMGRDGMLPFSPLLSAFSEKRHIPPYAMLTAAIFPAIIIIGSVVAEDALVAIISFGTIGIYIGFQMVVYAALRARLTGWNPAGAFRMGRWGVPVNVLALIWGVVAIVNIAWPRTPDAPWYINYIVLLSTAFIIAVGWIYMEAKKPYLKGDAPAGDANGRQGSMAGIGTEKGAAPVA
jgi:amino acid transporter